MCRDCTERRIRLNDENHSVEDFEEPRYRHPKRRAKKVKARGCQGNDWGKHVYVWTTDPENLFSWDDAQEFYKFHGFYRREYYVCCGCGKRSRSRHTAEFQRLLTKQGWYRANYGYRRNYSTWS